MNFKITPLFTEKDIQKDVERHAQAFHKIMVKELSRIGLEWVASARKKAPLEGWHRDASGLVTATKLAGGSLDLSGAGSFNDQTGNLRNSIGFIIFYDGQQVDDNFEQSASGGAEGMSIGRAIAATYGKDYPAGYMLILVAGMEYATFVEGKGFDVITGTTLNASQDIARAVQNVKRALST